VEYRVKAAFLYNFTKFVDWPPGDQHPAQPFIIGILGDDPFGDDIQRLAGKAVGDRSLSIRRYPAWDDAAATCDILFITASQKDDLETILDRLGGTSVLTVGDSNDFARRGVMINFFMGANKVRFEVNLKQATQAGFKISSRLLKLATIVDDRYKTAGCPSFGHGRCHHFPAGKSPYHLTGTSQSWAVSRHRDCSQTPPVLM
jgi:hypothetical protein